jgi:acyl CoA:acetate/3-ketoacid CoA transferase alpha subunit
MDLSELIELISRVEKGATVMFTNINVPGDPGAMYGIVTIGSRSFAKAEMELGFHDAEELRMILKRYAS